MPGAGAIMTTVADTTDVIQINTNDVMKAIKEIRDGFDDLDDQYLKRKYLVASVNQVVTPMLKTFKGFIPKLVTGNLKNSAAKVTRYYGNRIAVGLVGYQLSHSGKEDAKGWAQGFIEYGTGDRFTKGNIA